MSQNAVPTPADDVAARVARRTLDKRGPDYEGEVRRLLDAGLEVMRECGIEARPRVADIVAAAGLSNDAFYRHFPSKDALVAAILEDGNERVGRYLEHQMSKDPTPEGKVARWVRGVLAQAEGEAAATALAVLGNAGAGLAGAPASAVEPIAAPLRGPLAELGSDDPELDATLLAHAALGVLRDHLYRRTRPTSTETERVTAFCLAVAAGSSGARGRH